MCFAPVLSLDEAPQHPQNKTRVTFATVDGITQAVTRAALQPNPGRSLQAGWREPGAETRSVLHECGFTEDEIAALSEQFNDSNRPADEVVLVVLAGTRSFMAESTPGRAAHTPSGEPGAGCRNRWLIPLKPPHPYAAPERCLRRVPLSSVQRTLPRSAVHANATLLKSSGIWATQNIEGDKP